MGLVGARDFRSRESISSRTRVGCFGATNVVALIFFFLLFLFLFFFLFFFFFFFSWPGGGRRGPVGRGPRGLVGPPGPRCGWGGSPWRCGGRASVAVGPNGGAVLDRAETQWQNESAPTAGFWVPLNLSLNFERRIGASGELLIKSWIQGPGARRREAQRWRRPGLHRNAMPTNIDASGGLIFSRDCH